MIQESTSSNVYKERGRALRRRPRVSEFGVRIKLESLARATTTQFFEQQKLRGKRWI